jgi:hypothetical protein
MATAGRKARKAAQRAGEVSYTHPVKVGTPLVERAWFTALVWGAPGTRFATKQVRRSAKARSRALLARGEKAVK